MTADTSSDEAQHTDVTESDTGTARTHLLVAAVLFVLGLLGTSVAAIQLVLPDLAAGTEFLTYGRLAPASRLLLVDGWAVIGLLGLSYFALSSITGGSVRRKMLSLGSLLLITIGTVSGAIAILIGLTSGITGQESPLWARAIIALGVLLGALSISATAKAKGNALGAAGWYLVAAPILLALTTIVGLIPTAAGIAGVVANSFIDAGVTLFIVTASVGLIYFVLGQISGTDSEQTRPLAALGFWSLILIGAFMNGAGLIYSPAPNWLETIAVAFAIASFVPALAITADIGLMLKGSIAQIADRASLRYATTAGLALVAITAVNFLATFPATSSIVAFTTWVSGLELLVIVGGASFAIFAGHSVLTGGRRSGNSLHYIASTLGLVLIAAATLAGGVATGFSWAAGPTSQKFPNWGPGWEVTANTTLPFSWVVGIGLVLFTLAQIVFLVRIGATNDEELATPSHREVYDVEFSGDPKYLTWTKLVRGVTVVWIAAAVFTLVLPMVDSAGEEPSILADTYRTYEPGTAAFAGRDLYAAQGCAQCHSQEVRPVATDVGLGPVSLAADYANENPVFRGTVRIGPDLFHVATRVGFSAEVLKVHLKDPRAARPWSIMPSYSYLTDAEIDALVIYIETLR